MKGTAGLMVLAGLAQGNIAVNQINNVDPGE